MPSVSDPTTTPNLGARIEVFRTGTFTPMSGAPITYTAADLKAVADAYDPATAPAPIVVGHPVADAPAFGWVESFDFDATSDRLYANVGEIDPAFSAAVKAGRYKKVSMSFFLPDQDANPIPGTWYPKHIGFLGGAAPAVSGLANVKFSDAQAEAVTFVAEFGERGFEETASLFQSLREYLIEKFGMEDADKAIPSYKVEWLGDMEVSQNSRTAFAFPTLPPKKEIPIVDPNDNPAFAARETNLATREAAMKKRESKISHDDNVSFAETLVTDGKLLPASKDQVVAVLNALPNDATVAFTEGEAKIAPGAALRSILTAQPKMVEFGRAELPETATGETATFASDGKPVDQGQMDLHAKATSFQLQNPGTGWLDAVAAVS